MLIHRCRREDGVTLIELLVVLVLMGVVGGVVMTAIVSALDSARVTTERVTALNEIETALQRVARDLRTAEDVIITGDPRNSVSVNIVREVEESRTVSYRVEDAALIREDTSQTLVTFIDNDLDVEPVFTYYDRRGEEISCAPGVDPADHIVCPVDHIEITIVRGIEGRSPVVASTSVGVRNNVRYGSAS